MPDGSMTPEKRGFSPAIDRAPHSGAGGGGSDRMSWDETQGGTLGELISRNEKGWAEMFLSEGIYERGTTKRLPVLDKVNHDVLVGFLRCSGAEFGQAEEAYQKADNRGNELEKRAALAELLKVGRSEYVKEVAPEVLREVNTTLMFYEEKDVYGVEKIREQLGNINRAVAVLVEKRWKNAGWAGDRAKFLRDYVKAKFLKEVYVWLKQPNWAPETTPPPPPAPKLPAGPEAGVVANRERLKNENSLRLYMRQKAIEIIGDEASEAKLNYRTIEGEIRLGLGWEKETQAQVDLFGYLPPTQKEKVRELVKAEIEARCGLKAAQLKEKSLRRPEIEKADARKQTAAGSGELDREVHRWLASVTDLGEKGGVTVEKVDQAFSVLVLLGEGFPETPQPWMRDFVSFAKAEDKKDPRKTKGFWDPAYPVEQRERVFELLKERFGSDAANVAHQLFDAYKLEGKYNWDHYLNGLYGYSATRSVLTALAKPVYLGSQRKYKDPEFVVPRTRLQQQLFEARGRNDLGEIKNLESQIKALGYGAEIQRLGLSPLDVKGSDRYIDDPKIPGAKKGNEVQGLYLEKVKKGTFLRDTPWTDTVLVSYLPQEASAGSVKAGDKFATAITTIGGIGAEGDRKTKVDAAVKAVTDMRTAGINLVETGTSKPEEVDKQIREEVLNILWELSLYNDLNIDMIGEDPNFLLPSQLNQLFVRLGGRAEGGVPIISTEEQYVEIRKLVEEIRQKTWKISQNWLGDKKEFQEDALKHRGLPRGREQGIRPLPRNIFEAGFLMAANLFSGEIFRRR